MPCPARLSSDAATLRHTRLGLVVGTKLGTVHQPSSGRTIAPRWLLVSSLGSDCRRADPGLDQGVGVSPTVALRSGWIFAKNIFDFFNFSIFDIFNFEF